MREKVYVDLNQILNEIGLTRRWYDRRKREQEEKDKRRRNDSETLLGELDIFKEILSKEIPWYKQVARRVKRIWQDFRYEYFLHMKVAPYLKSLHRKGHKLYVYDHSMYEEDYSDDYDPDAPGNHGIRKSGPSWADVEIFDPSVPALHRKWIWTLDKCSLLSRLRMYVANFEESSPEKPLVNNILYYDLREIELTLEHHGRWKDVPDVELLTRGIGDKKLHFEIGLSPDTNGMTRQDVAEGMQRWIKAVMGFDLECECVKYDPEWDEDALSDGEEESDCSESEKPHTVN